MLIRVIEIGLAVLAILFAGLWLREEIKLYKEEIGFDKILLCKYFRKWYGRW